MKVLDIVGTMGGEENTQQIIPYSIFIFEEEEKNAYDELLLDFKTAPNHNRDSNDSTCQNMQRRLKELMHSYFESNSIDLNNGEIFQVGEEDKHVIYYGSKINYSHFLQGKTHLHLFEQTNNLCITSSIDFSSQLDWSKRENAYSRINAYLLMASFEQCFLHDNLNRKIKQDEKTVYIAPLNHFPKFLNWTTLVAPHLQKTNIEDYCALYEAYQRVTKERKSDKPNQRELILKQHLKNAFELELNKIKTITANRNEDTI